MGPPLGPRRDTIDAVGSANLAPKQRRQVKAFIDDRLLEKKAQESRQRALGAHWDSTSQYCIHPPAEEPTPNRPFWRFSCIGLVMQAYRDGGLELLAGPFPRKTIGDLKALYPNCSDELDDPAVRVRLGIGEGDDWPVALVGYVLQALNREDELVNGATAQPYQPMDGDEYFPRKE